MIGIITNVAAVVIGGLLGGLCKRIVPKKIMSSLFVSTAFCAFGIGIVSIIKMDNLAIVMISIMLGCVIGELCSIEHNVSKLINYTTNKLCGTTSADDLDRALLFNLAMAIICFSGTGLFGAFAAGMDNDSSILISKSVLDFFTVLTIASQVGYFVIVFSIPQTVILLLCYFLAKLISPILTVDAILNFKAVGGILTLMIGYNVIASQTGLKKVNILNLTPSFVLVILITWLYNMIL